jgi:MoaA/NifB/PqqE/SkfB family radical SAM enzyme
MKDKKQFLLEESETFCMYPWVHLHTTPEGSAGPCCIFNTEQGDFGNSRNNTIKELVNSERMNKLRLDMINGVKNQTCSQCYAHDRAGIHSARKTANMDFGKYFDEVADYTNLADGTLSDFKMRYFDIRFNNLCNFKCRTCNSSYSSQWEVEDIKHGSPHARKIPKNDHQSLVDEVLGYIDDIQMAYFAGGEPLINEQHYIILEEFIRRGRTDVILRYNSNISSFKYKDKDILDLWSRFDKDVEVYASIDHFGERAEYIRHGTDWGVVEQNLKLLFETPFVYSTLNTVLSCFNYVTLKEFYQYLNDLGMYDNRLSLFPMNSPRYFTTNVLPYDIKQLGHHKLDELFTFLNSIGHNHINNAHFKNLISAREFTNSEHTWDVYKDLFRQEIDRIDTIRGENFVDVFPELASMMDG